jgi:hypothetical protein
MESKIWKYLIIAWILLSFYTFKLHLYTKTKCSEGQCNHINIKSVTTLIKEDKKTIGKIDSTFCMLCDKFIGYEKIIIR